ncbi:hypothetical protein AYO20_08118 [Fonsecaea nubica]|uniref:Major facilitator superfamily (MFS) profile domain-containing protein n=1 Tax=Fonsecaea nubica TaxID=856822 RepID=A0A178CS35_9EURO|nr:hypothetical protein AYO20_08118 [Fonsecaea nubica]OAL31725.1 hypothetical protein AYO20_08118 [Fonsecaea nubica]
MTICGISGGTSMNAFSCSAELVPRKQRGVVFFALTFISSGFITCGSLIGQAMLREPVGWRIVSYYLIGIYTWTTVSNTKPASVVKVTEADMPTFFNPIGYLA